MGERYFLLSKFQIDASWEGFEILGGLLTVWIVDATHMSVVTFVRFCLRLYDSLSLVFWIQR
jgi:hypothetical protein